MLELLHEIYGLKVNFSKNCIVEINVEERALRRATFLLHCQIGEFPISHLGMSLSPGALHCRDWLVVVQKFESKLAGWKARLLSDRGRMMLCNPVLDILPIYYLSIFRIPKTVAKKLESIQVIFF